MGFLLSKHRTATVWAKEGIYMARRTQIKDIETAVKIFYTYPELGTKQVQELYDCGRNKATELKAIARKLQDEKGILTYSSSSVNTRCAYEAWGIDIEDLEKRLIVARKLFG